MLEDHRNQIYSNLRAIKAVVRMMRATYLDQSDQQIREALYEHYESIEPRVPFLIDLSKRAIEDAMAEPRPVDLDEAELGIPPGYLDTSDPCEAVELKLRPKISAIMRPEDWWKHA